MNELWLQARKQVEVARLRLIGRRREAFVSELSEGCSGVKGCISRPGGESDAFKKKKENQISYPGEAGASCIFLT